MKASDKIYYWLKSWKRKGYSAGIPDQAPPELEKNNKVPSYRKACLALLKNDLCLTSLGFSKTSSEVYNSIKRSEIFARGGKIKPEQMRLF